MNRHEVKFESDANLLNGWLYKLSNESDPAPAVIWHHGDGDNEASSPDELAAAFNDKGFIVFAPVRRFHDSTLGPPADPNEPADCWAQTAGKANATSSGRTRKAGTFGRCRTE